MKANELRIGNYYDHNGEVKKVNPDTIQEVYEAKRIWCNPIPLTEEWLLRLGFKKIIVESYPIYIFDGFMIEIYTDNCVVCYNNSEINKIKFVHLLQNLYFSIKLKELLCDNI